MRRRNNDSIPATSFNQEVGRSETVTKVFFFANLAEPNIHRIESVHNKGTLVSKNQDDYQVRYMSVYYKLINGFEF